jgi:hypothetical protein
MALSQRAITNAKPTDKPYMLLDGEGYRGPREFRIKTYGKKFKASCSIN